MTNENLTGMTIGEIVRTKGPRAGELLDAALCTDGERLCCPGVTLHLGYAVKLLGKESALPKLVKDLASL